jgi:hypothetical protein
MLKAKLKGRPSRRKEQALKEVSKSDNEKAIFVRVTSREMKKLKTHLLSEDCSLASWVKEKIAEI